MKTKAVRNMGKDECLESGGGWSRREWGEEKSKCGDAEIRGGFRGGRYTSEKTQDPLLNSKGGHTRSAPAKCLCHGLEVGVEEG